MLTVILCLHLKRFADILTPYLTAPVAAKSQNSQTAIVIMLLFLCDRGLLMLKCSAAQKEKKSKVDKRGCWAARGQSHLRPRQQVTAYE